MRSIVPLGLQILCVIFIFISGPLVAPVIVFILIQILGVLLIVWALLARKQSKSVSKLPRGYFFATTGPYEIIRHPIYAGLFFLLFALVQSELTPLRGLVLIIFIIAMLVKISLDEAVMRQHVKEYLDYQSKTRRLIPYLF
jgi:protein-S-isoprenylcysteine O-methyltransferase Ste14